MSCSFIRWISILGGAFEQGKARSGSEKGAALGGVFSRFTSHKYLKYTPAVTSQIFRGLLYDVIRVELGLGDRADGGG